MFFMNRVRGYINESITQTNNKSVTSLATGKLSIVIPFIGLVLGVIGLEKQKEKYLKQRKLVRD